MLIFSILYDLVIIFVFFRLNGIQLIADCFDFQDLPVIIAHALITIVCNLKMWLNVRSIVTLFFPLRAKVLRYMCQMSDKDLRSPAIKLISGLSSFFVNWEIYIFKFENSRTRNIVYFKISNWKKNNNDREKNDLLTNMWPRSVLSKFLTSFLSTCNVVLPNF